MKIPFRVLFHGTLIFLLAACHAASAAQPPEETPDKPTEKSAESSAAKERTELIRKLQEAPLAEAQAALDAAIAASPETYQLQQFRSLLAARLAAANDMKAATDQMQTACESLLKSADNPAAFRSLAGLLETFRSYLARTSEPQRLTPLLTQALENARSKATSDAKGRYLVPLAQLTGLQARELNTAGQTSEAMELLNSEFKALRPSFDSADSGEQSLLAGVQLLQSRQMLNRNADATATASHENELEELFAKGLSVQPKSAAIAAEFVRFRTASAGRIYRDQPEAARKILDDTRDLIEKTEIAKAPPVVAALVMIKPMERRIETAILHREMIGKPAPAIDAAAWVNGEALDLSALKGKVLLLDFWAVWCGPCIATFPHLTELHNEFHEQGLEIIGVTRQYGYEWNADTSRAAKSKADVSMENELAMLNQFMQHHQLKHASIVTPKESEMMKQFGVSGIPHAVLIDRQGHVRMIKVGSGTDNARALHDMAKQLLAE